jgi:Rod binding domain-containing protein
MTITPLAPATDASNIPIEELAANKHLNEQQKVAEASRQFEAIMLRQILSESQKPVITSEFTDNSTAAGIYQDYITNTLADSMSKAGTVGLTKVFEQQLSHPAPKTGLVSQTVDPTLVQKSSLNAHPESAHRIHKPLSQAHHE